MTRARLTVGREKRPACARVCVGTLCMFTCNTARGDVETMPTENPRMPRPNPPLPCSIALSLLRTNDTDLITLLLSDAFFERFMGCLERACACSRTVYAVCNTVALPFCRVCVCVCVCAPVPAAPSCGSRAPLPRRRRNNTFAGQRANALPCAFPLRTSPVSLAQTRATAAACPTATSCGAACASAPPCRCGTRSWSRSSPTRSGCST